MISAKVAIDVIATEYQNLSHQAISCICAHQRNVRRNLPPRLANPPLLLEGMQLSCCGFLIWLCGAGNWGFATIQPRSRGLHMQECVSPVVIFKEADCHNRSYLERVGDGFVSVSPSSIMHNC